MPYVSLVTPDGGYYVGMDMPSILHPQTLLAYEMNGEPLNPRTRRAAASGDADQIRHQANQTHRAHRIHKRATGGLLGGTRLRLVCRTLIRVRRKTRVFSEFQSSKANEIFAFVARREYLFSRRFQAAKTCPFY